MAEHPRTGEFSSRSMSSADRSEPDIPSATKAVTEPMINPRNAAASTITTGEVDADFAVVARPISSPGSGSILLRSTIEVVYAPICVVIVSIVVWTAEPFRAVLRTVASACLDGVVEIRRSS